MVPSELDRPGRLPHQQGPLEGVLSPLDAKEELGGGGAHRGKGRGPGLYESEWSESFSHDRDSMVDPEGWC